MKKNIPPVLLILLALFFPGGGLMAQTVGMDLSPNPVGVGDNISLVVELPAETVSDVVLDEVAFPRGIQIWRGPYLRPFTTLSSSGDPVSQVRITYTLRSLRAGRILMEPLLFKAGEREFPTDPVLLEVGNYSNRRLVFPLELEWQSSSDFIYRGEAVALTLTLLRQKEIGLIDGFSVAPPGSGFLEGAPGIKSITAYALAGVPLYDIPVASYIYTPATVGKVVIAGGTVERDGLTGRSDRIELDVMPLPPEVDPTGAVGQFELVGTTDAEELRTGMTFRFSLILSGTGNLNYLKIPELLVEGGKVISMETDAGYTPSSAGYAGQVIQHYTLEVTDSNRLAIRQPAFPFVEKRTGRIKVLPARNRVFSILPALEIEGPVDNTSSGPDIYLQGSSLLSFFDYGRNPLLWLFLLPGPLALALFALFRKPRSRRITLGLMLFLLSFNLHGDDGDSWAVHIEKAEQLLQADDIRGARAELGVMPGDPYEAAAWHFASAALASRENNHAEAVWHLRSALMDRPMSSRIREQLKLTESSALVGDAYPPPLPLDRRLFFLLLLLMVNAAAVTGIFIMLKPRSGRVILFILFLAGSAGMASLMGVAEISLSRSYGVVMPDIPEDTVYLKRVPREEAQEWFLLKSGTTLLLREKVGDYYLTENGALVTGWIHQDQVKKVGPRDE